MKKIFFIIMMIMGVSLAQQPDNKHMVGFTYGVAAPRGVFYGIKSDGHWWLAGGGLTFDGNTSGLSYNIGGMHLLPFQYNRLNNTHLWSSLLVHGEKNSDQEKLNNRMTIGVGPGITLHGGFPFALVFELGYQASYLFNEDQGFEFGPAVNFRLLYSM